MDSEAGPDVPHSTTSRRGNKKPPWIFFIEPERWGETFKHWMFIPHTSFYLFIVIAMKQSKTFKSFLIQDKAKFTDMYRTLAECCDNPLVDYPSEGVTRQTFFRNKQLVFKTYRYAHDLWIHDYRDGHEAKYHFEVRA